MMTGTLRLFASEARKEVLTKKKKEDEETKTSKNQEVIFCIENGIIFENVDGLIEGS